MEICVSTRLLYYVVGGIIIGHSLLSVIGLYCDGVVGDGDGATVTVRPDELK